MNCNKKIISLGCIACLILGIFFSCTNSSNNANQMIFTPSTDTIRYKTSERIDQTPWTEELIRNTPSKSSASKSKIFFSSVGLSASLNKQIEKSPIYPELENFGSLNTSTIDSSTKVEITKLINKIKEENITKSDFLLGYQHEKILFDYEFSKHSKISGYFLGSPLEQSENHIFIPVQFLFEDGKLNSKIYLEKKDNTFKIKQIVFGEFISDQ